MKWQNKYVYSWIITRYTTVTLLLVALYMYTGVFPFLFIYFLHLRLFKHYLSLEMYLHKSYDQFHQEQSFLFLFCISLFTTIFFTWQKANPYMLRIFTNPLTKQSCTKFISEQNCKLTFFQYSHSSGHCTYFSISLSIHTECVFVPTTVLLFTDK